MAVEVGAEFRTFEDLTNAIRTYEAENFVNLIIRDTRKVEAAAKRNQRKKYNSAIKYSDISYCCTYGGKKYVCHSTGKRSHKTIKQACPFSLKVRATVDGQRLFVREMCVGHNHQLSEADFRLHPRQRKLDISSQEEIANLLSMEPDKKLLREKLMQITGKVILMKDIHNIKTRFLNPRIKQKDCKSEIVDKKGEENVVDMWKDGAKIETAEMETQTESEGCEEICLPVSHTLSEVDSSHHSILFHHADQQLNTDVRVRDCYIDGHQTQPYDVYTVNIQAFEPVELYSVGSQPYQQTSSGIVTDNITHDVHQVDPSVRSSKHFQHWTLENVDQQAVHESDFQTVTVYPFPDQHTNTYSTHENNPLHSVHISSTRPIHSTIPENSTFPQSHEKQEELHSQIGTKQMKRPTGQQVRPKKKRLNSDQKDKELIIKKYFQQATVNLFFNERLKSPGSKLLKVLRPGTFTAKMSTEGQTDTQFHDLLKPLSWLFGKWHATNGKGIYPTITDFSYAEEAVFEPVPMKPVVQYRMFSWRSDNNMTLHRESGYIRIKPETQHIAFVASHAMGVVEIQEGEVNGQELTVETKNIGRVSFNLPPEVKVIRRNIKRIENQLEEVVFMQTDKTELTEHLRITFKKVE